MSFIYDLPPETKQLRPTTRGEAVSLIEEAFTADGNEWGENEQNWFIESIGLKGNWKTFDNVNLREILSELERLKMVIFES